MEVTLIQFLSLSVLLALFIFLWITDAFFTVKTARVYELKERNPLIRELLKRKRVCFWIFKLVDLMFLVFLNVMLAYSSITLAIRLLAVFVLVYTLIGWDNWRIIKRIETEKGIKIPLFIID